MNNLMLDLETMGNTPNSPVISIGAVFFDPKTGDLGASTEINISLESSMQYGAIPDASTIMWWMKQCDDARLSVSDATKTLESALREFHLFVSEKVNTNYVQVWGNGASFDCVILRNSYQLAGLTPPWQWWNDRDVRTVVEMGKVIGMDPKRDMPFVGVRHTAVADAIHQAKYVSAIYQALTTK
ncbi:3'-5' exoribonuclease [Providencia rettgeri]|nr:3'-5' exoribonuclease [Providencia rettgeri]ELR5189152.1 3'-5' exoribonuclease [Providencia rettgeri]ELY3856784.1 3'-5' exoribonuclease [Providencia rettgeri]EMB0753499.1 3'-5' exoribonuclease [Providencia rettgeri]